MKVTNNKVDLHVEERTKKIIDSATELCVDAYNQLIAEGLSHTKADARVKANFERYNRDHNAVVTLEQLCKQ